MSAAPRETLQGRLLLSHPGQRHAAFRRTVIFMLSHTAQGAMGVVLNRPMGKTVGEVAAGFSCTALSGVALHEGGPMKRDALMFCGWHGITGGHFQMRCGLSREQATEVLSAVPGAQVRCFCGHAGWSPGQLEVELGNNGWVVAPLNFNLLFRNGGVALWQAFLKEYHPVLHVFSDAPDELSAN